MNKEICAVICEFNPFHNGHKNLLLKAKEKENRIEHFVGLMSGNFSQRSEPCILDKYSRAEIAIKNGFDLIINLPTAFCINNAEIFAFSSIKILNELNVDFIAFGVETPNEKAFFSLAKFLLREPVFFKKELKKFLKEGKSYNQSQISAIENWAEKIDKENCEDIKKIISRPNNVLALEYIKSLLKSKSKIKPILVERVDNYNNEKIIENFSSSTNIRKEISTGNFDKIKNFIPQNSLEYLQKANLNLWLYKKILLTKIKLENKKDFSKIYSVSEGLENRILNLACSTKNYDDFFEKLKTKRYKERKLKSILLNTLLGIDKKLIQKLYTIKTNIFVKALAISSEKTEILSQINTKKLIVRKNDINKIKHNQYNKKLFEVENRANSIYNIISKSEMLEEDIYNKMRIIWI